MLDTADLRTRIDRFRFDEPGTQLTFVARLARESDWSRAYALRVVEEYKRFLFLAMTAGHVVTPSEDVDRAWHLHLTYTHSYWRDLCDDCLGRPLHHQPTQGGSEECSKYLGLYERTRESYARAFGEAPPSDIWPPARQRFGEDVHARWVNHRRNWIIPKPRFLRRPQAAIWAAPALLPVLGAITNPLDLNGSEFLRLYGTLFAGAVVLCMVLRAALRRDGGSAVRSEPDGGGLAPEEIGLLAAGEERAATAAFTSLTQQGVLELDGRRVSAVGALPQGAGRIEDELFRFVEKRGKPKLKTAIGAVAAASRDVRAKLETRGLLESAASFANARLAMLLVMVPLLALGAAKIVVGVGRGKPVLYLILFCAAALGATYFLTRRPHRTALGERVLNGARTGRTSNESSANATDELDPTTSQVVTSDLALGVALFGAAHLTGTVYDAIPAALAPIRGAGASFGDGTSGGVWFGDSGSGCGGSGCGGGCGGCGGCGS